MVVAYLAILLFSVNFMLQGKYILSLLFVGQCIKKKRIIVDSKFCILLAFSFLYSICFLLSSSKLPIDVLLLPVGYLIGLNWELDSLDKIDTVIKVFFCLSMGMCFHVFLNLSSEIISNGGFNYGAIHYDFWSGSVSSSTGQMMNFTMSATLITYLLFMRGKYLLSFIIILPCFIYGNIVGSRTTMFICGLSIIVGIVILIRNIRKNNVKKTLLILLLISLIFFVIIQANIFGISDIFNKSYLFSRFNNSVSAGESIFSTQRWGIKGEYLVNALEWPWGGGKIRQMSNNLYAHDIFLDTLSEGGIICLILLISYFVFFIKNILRFIRANNTLEIKLLFIPYIVIVLIQMFLEPVIDGAPIFLTSVILIDGVITNANRMRVINENSFFI